MTVFKAFAIILTSAIGFALVGGGVGWTLGTVTPAYYRTVYGYAGQRPGFDPVQVGLGLGITQGLVCGVFVGVVVVLAVAWHQSRRLDRTPPKIDPIDVRPFSSGPKGPIGAIKEPDV
jgi:hypothetical protein